MSDSDQHWNPDHAWAPPDYDAPETQPSAPTPPAAPAPTPPAAPWWGQAPADPQPTPPAQPTTPVAPTPPAAPSWPPQPPTPQTPQPSPAWSGSNATPSWSAPSATSWPPQPPSATIPPPVPPSGGGWGTPAWQQPPAQPSSVAPHKRVLAVIAAIALVLASAGIGAVVAVAVHDNNSSSNTAFPNVPAFNGNGSSNSNGSNPFGNSPGGSSSNGSSSTGSVNVRGIASTVTPAIVNINTTLAQGRAAGTGIVISSSGVVLTNNHVIADATSVKVDIGGSGNTHPAHVIGYDVQDDVALVQIEGVSNLKTVTFGNAPRVGDPVVAIGNALGKGGTPSVTSGKVTALNQQVTAGDPSGGRVETLHGMIQIDAPIQPGDSGGALVNANSQVIGINTAAAGGRFSQQTGSNIGFAIPIDNAVSIAKMIESGTKTDRVHIGPRALLGVSVRAANDPTAGTQSPVDSGALVVGVEGNSAASVAGIQEGDVITRVAGRTIADDNALHNALTVYYPGQSVQVTWVDANGNSHSASIKLGQGPPA